MTVLIEEPEAHMHPQMQQVFISQIKGIIEDADDLVADITAGLAAVAAIK